MFSSGIGIVRLVCSIGQNAQIKSASETSNITNPNILRINFSPMLAIISTKTGWTSYPGADKILVPIGLIDLLTLNTLNKDSHQVRDLTYRPWKSPKTVLHC